MKEALESGASERGRKPKTAAKATKPPATKTRATSAAVDVVHACVGEFASVVAMHAAEVVRKADATAKGRVTAETIEQALQELRFASVVDMSAVRAAVEAAEGSVERRSASRRKRREKARDALAEDAAEEQELLFEAARKRMVASSP